MAYQPTGPWAVGVRDLAYYTGPGEISADGHLVARLFYPAAAASSSGMSSSLNMQWSSPILWTNAWNRAYGYARYAFVFNKKWMLEPIKYLVAAVVLSLGGTCRIPGTWNAAAGDPTAAAAAAAAAGTQTVAGGAAAAAGGRLQTNVHADARSEAAPAESAGNGTGDGAGHGLPPVNGFPVLLVSHGLAGQRNTYSCICTEMASQGFVVVAFEHADGTASVAHLAGPGLSWLPNVPRETAAQAQGRWRWFRGIGEREAYLRRTQFRLHEVQTALRLLQALHDGTAASTRGLTVTGADGLSFLKGRLDMGRVAIVGHSFGGATAALAAASDPAIKCGVALDPWWDALPDSCPTLDIWTTDSPLLIIGSHVWNTPNPVTGKMSCNGELQEQVLAAAQMTGGGALLMVPRHSTHSSFDDILLLFGSNPLVKSIMSLLQTKKTEATLAPKRAHEINIRTLLHFLRHHLPDPTDLSDPSTAAAAAGQPPAPSLGPESRPMAGLHEAVAAAAAAIKEAVAGGKGAVGAPKPFTPGCDAAYREILGSDLEQLVLASLNK